MGKSITDKEQQVVYMKQRLNMFLEVLDSIEPETAELEDIDRLIAWWTNWTVKCSSLKIAPNKKSK